MATFQFPLNRLLDIRREFVEAIEREIEACHAKREKLIELRNQRRDAYFEDRARYNEFLRLGEVDKLPLYEQSMECCKGQIIEILTVIREVQSEIDLLQQSRVAAKRDVKVVENLKDKRFSEYLRNEEMKERKLLDEQATMGHLRREQAEKREENG
jgi:flagellar export protein FliJ